MRDGAVGGARVLRNVLAHQVEETLQLLACHRPGGWRPTTELRGAHNLVSALTAGNGAVLWVANSAFASLVVKMALHDAGFKVHHLSHPRHGFSPTQFGMRWLNPIRTKIEAKYLASRAVLPLSHNAGPVLARLVDRLKEGGVVSVTAQATSLRPIAVPFLGGTLNLAPGAPGIAHRSGAALLPVFTTRDAVDHHTVTIEPALPLPRGIAERAGLRARGAGLRAAACATGAATAPAAGLAGRMQARRRSAPASRSNSVRRRSSAGIARESRRLLSLKNVKRAAPIRHRPFLDFAASGRRSDRKPPQ